MNPKQLSGAQKRKNARERAELERREQEERNELYKRAGVENPADLHLAAYRALGDPPLDDPTRALIYAQNCMLVALREVTTDPIITAPDRWRLISDLGGKIGMTHAKALVQAKLDKVTKKLDNKKDVSGGPKALHGIVRPATARDGSDSRGHDSTDRSLPDSEASEDGGDAAMGGGPLGSGGEEVP